MSGGLEPFDAKKLLRRVCEVGKLELTNHAEEVLRKAKLDLLDCMNVLRGGSFEYPEWENGTWTHRASTSKMTVVVAIDEHFATFTITDAWRNQS